MTTRTKTIREWVGDLVSPAIEAIERIASKVDNVADAIVYLANEGGARTPQPSFDGIEIRLESLMDDVAGALSRIAWSQEKRDQAREITVQWSGSLAEGIIHAYSDIGHGWVRISRRKGESAQVEALWDGANGKYRRVWPAALLRSRDEEYVGPAVSWLTNIAKGGLP